MEAGELDQWASTVVLGDGDTAVIRPITPADAAALGAFHQRQSADSRYLRFFSPKPELSQVELERFTNVDFVGRAAFVVEQHGEFIAWASYERWKNRDDAEVAFMVDDQHHSKGIASLLLEHLAAVARSNGLRRFNAQTLSDNRSMLAVFAKAGWPVHRKFDSGVVDIEFPLDETAEFIDSMERREQRADSAAIARLLLPTSIAVIGASDTTGSVGHELWTNVTSGPQRRVYPVNARHTTIGGVQAYASVTDIPEDVGLAVIAVPIESLPATIEECIEKRVRGAVVVTSADGAELDMNALVSHARHNGLRIIGPTSMGIASPRTEVALQAALVDVTLPGGNVAISMQSGSLGSSLLRLADQLQLGLSWFVSLGDKSDVSANDLLQFWEDDEATKVIGLYTESLGNPRKFARIARRVSMNRPIVAVRTGAASVGVANEALYRETGVIEVPTVSVLLDTVRVLSTQPSMAGNRVAVLTNARSPGVLASATLAAAGLEVVDQPSGLRWDARSIDYEQALEAALADVHVDAVLVIHAPPVESAVGEPTMAIERACAGAAKPVVAVMLGALDGPLQPGSSIPAFAFPEQAAAVLGRLAAWSVWRANLHDHGDAHVPEPIDMGAADDVISQHLDEGTMTASAIRTLLGSYTISMPATVQVPSLEAVSAADHVGYPVAVKARRRQVGQTVEAGVALDLRHGTEVAEAVAIMCAHLGDGADEVIVQRMVSPGVDVRMRVSVDARIGPVLTFGLGGAQADLIGDISSRLAPVTSAAARAMVSETRAAAALDESATDAVVDLLMRVGQLVTDHPQITTLDLNPVIVTTDRCWVVDATIRLEAPTRPGHPTRRLEET
jgi:acyl-CoA synthetase (NDP forming)/GNAT superfamily N-acetyltransferase